MPDDIPARQAGRRLLRLVSCGSVDDGKSTLIGRLIAETGPVSDDQRKALATLSRRYGTTGDQLDDALLLDGLESEHEQGITIDVAYRYFGTARRDFIVADAPGHEQYTRNMVTGASNADLALLLVDARRGLSTQTMRHARIAALLRLQHVVLAVNKMDLVEFDRQAFARIEAAFAELSAQLGFATVTSIPICARDGDNVTRPSARMPWYAGATIIRHLEEADVEPLEMASPARFLVQNVVRGDGGQRCYSGLLASGSLGVGDAVVVARSGRATRLSRIIGSNGDLERALPGQAATIELADHSDVGRGDIIAPEHASPQIADQLAAQLVWFDEHPLLPGRTYTMQIGTQSVAATVTALRHVVQIETGEHVAARTLHLNDIGLCNLATSTPIAFDAYHDNRLTGGFILVDRELAATVGAGMVHFALHRAHNVQRQSYDVDRTARAHMKGQQPCIVWFTGLSGAGKSTILNLVEQRLNRQGFHTYALDGDNLRLGLNRDLGFTDADRVRECPPGRRGRAHDARCRPGRAVRVHIAVPGRAANDPRAGGPRRVHRGVRRCTARDMHHARPERSLREGAGRPRRACDRHRLSLRAAAAAGDPSADHRGERGFARRALDR